MQSPRSTSLPTPICSTQVGRGGSSRDPVWDLSLWLNAHIFVRDRSFTEHARTVGVLRTFSGTVARAGLRVALVSLDAWGPEEVRVQDLLCVFREVRLSASSVVQWLESDGTVQPIGWRQLWAPVLSALRQAMQGT